MRWSCASHSIYNTHQFYCYLLSAMTLESDRSAWSPHAFVAGHARQRRGRDAEEQHAAKNATNKPKTVLVVYFGMLAFFCAQTLILSGLRRNQYVADADRWKELWVNAGPPPTTTATSMPVEAAENHQHQSTSSTSSTVHVLYGLHGKNKGFLDQWEVNLKSTLLNAPLDQPLHIHIIANTLAERAIRKRLVRAQLGEINDADGADAPPKMKKTKENIDGIDATLSQSTNDANSVIAVLFRRQPTRITIYNVEKYHDEWKSFLTNKFRGKDLDEAYPMGVYYRLLAHKVILPYWEKRRRNKSESSPEVDEAAVLSPMDPILYMDADVVVLSNLNDLWRNVLPEDQRHTLKSADDVDQRAEDLPVIYQWSATWPNSGFAIYYLQEMERFWELLDELPEISHTNDQSLLGQVAMAFPKVAGTLPKEWDTHMGHGWRSSPQKLLRGQERVGMAHFTGKTPGRGQSYMDTEEGVLKYCIRSKTCRKSKRAREDFMKSWGLVDYYIRIPWHYVRYFGESQIPIGGESNEHPGHPLKIEVVR